MLVMLVPRFAKSLQSNGFHRRALKEIQLMLMMLVLRFAKSLQSLSRTATAAVGSTAATSDKGLEKKSRLVLRFAKSLQSLGRTATAAVSSTPGKPDC